MSTASRRMFLKAVPLSAAGIWLASRQGRSLAVQKAGESPVWREPSLSDLNRWIVPAEHFFVRHHLQVPRLNVETWKLVVEGLVKRRLEISYSQLLQRPRTSQIVTLECAGNSPGGGMVGNAHWTGVSLATLLKEAGLKAEASEVILDGADFGLDEGEYVPTSYSRSLPLEKAMAPETMLAFEMNGAILDSLHGYPLRAVVPGWYAMANVKWLRRIEVTDRPFAGFYMSKRYFTAKRDAITGEFIISPVRETAIKSQIALPANGVRLTPEPYTIRGMAWTGRGKVERVEVSMDGGSRWQEATLAGERAPWAWVFWTYLWHSPEVGEHVLLARAFDNEGNTQPAAEDPERINHYANNWIHRVKVTVATRNVGQSPAIQNR